MVLKFGTGRGFGHTNRLTQGGFSPLALFAAGEVGAWYDPNDLTTVFQDAAGTTPGAVGSVVGLVRDKSGRGNHATQATTTSKTILRLNATTGAHYLECDGVDDFLVTAAINFTGTDKMSVFAGVRKLSDAAIGMICELSPNVGANNGTFWLAAPIGAAAANYDFSSKGTVGQSKTRSGFASPHTAVLTGTGSIAADAVNLRVNGNDAGAFGGDQGTGNYGNHALYIGRRNGASLPFNGHIYGLIVRGAASTAAQIASTEAWLNQRTGAY